MFIADKKTGIVLYGRTMAAFASGWQNVELSQPIVSQRIVSQRIVSMNLI